MEFLPKTSETITLNSTSKILATAEPMNASNSKIYYSSSNSSIVSVDTNGYIRGNSIGSTYISISAENITKLYKVTVVNSSSGGGGNSGGGGGTSTTVALNSISIPSTLSVQEGSTSKLTVTYSPSNATNKKVTWKSSDTSIATVDGNGNVKGIASGEATITVTSNDGNKTATCVVTVTGIDKTLKSISLNKTELTLDMGQEETLTVTFNPANTDDKNIRWVSSNDEIATVEDGKVKALRPGTAEIKAKGAENTEATCTVTVLSAPIESISFSDESITVYVDSITTLVPVPFPENTAITDPIWISSDETVALVADGTVTAQKVGTATITISNEEGDITASIIVNVVEKPQEKLIITIDGYDIDFDPNTKDYTLEIGNESELTIRVNRAENKYTISGNRDLKNGSIITVTVKDKTKVTYVINIKKKQNYAIYFIGVISILLFANIIRILIKNKKKK